MGGTCGHFRHRYGASHGFGQNLFEADHATKKVADHCYDMFRGSTGWWRCTPRRSYPYALPNYCAPTACARIFQDEDWWMNRRNQVSHEVSFICLGPGYLILVEISYKLMRWHVQGIRQIPSKSELL